MERVPGSTNNTTTTEEEENGRRFDELQILNFSTNTPALFLAKRTCVCEWRMEMENGEWRMENGEWRAENGEWRMENGEQLTFTTLVWLLYKSRPSVGKIRPN